MPLRINRIVSGAPWNFGLEAEVGAATFVFDQEAEIFGSEQAGRAGDFAGARADDAELEPHGFGADSDGRVDDGRNFFGAAEDVDDVDGLGDASRRG